MGRNLRVDEELKVWKGVGRHFTLREVVTENEREREGEREETGGRKRDWDPDSFLQTTGRRIRL